MKEIKNPERTVKTVLFRIFFCGRITVYICGVISLKILLRLRCKTYSFSQFLELECSHHIKSSGIGDAH